MNKPRAVGALPLVLVVIATSVPLLLMLGVRSSCISNQSYPSPERWCFSEIPRLLFDEQLRDGRVPYLEPCTPSPIECDEYPPVTMFAMWAVSLIESGPTGYFMVAGVILVIAAVTTSVTLERLVGARALYFAAAPTLILYAFVNWDLLAVAAMVLGIVAYLRAKDVRAGSWLGVGTATKLLPGAFVPSIAADSRSRHRASTVIMAAVGAWLILNIGFAMGSFTSWAEFITFNASRGPDRDSLWYLVCARASVGPCLATSDINTISALLFVAISTTCWIVRRRLQPRAPMWSCGFVFLAVFFLTNKVYSPQYDLFLLPWFALAMPRIRLYMAFQVSSLLVAVTRFPITASNPWLDASLLLRDAALVCCIVAFVTLPGSEPDSDILRATAEADVSGLMVA